MLCCVVCPVHMTDIICKLSKFLQIVFRGSESTGYFFNITKKGIEEGKDRRERIASLFLAVGNGMLASNE